MLKIYLVIQGLPNAVSTCAMCTPADGSVQFIRFDGLQLGFKLRYRTALTRVAAQLKSINRE